MKTKREQIEEITSIIDSDICDKDCSNRCPYCGGLSSREAEKIYNAGYRKVGKDEIVVKKSEQKQCREIGELRAKVKQAQIDILNKANERLNVVSREFGDDCDLCGVSAVCSCRCKINELIEEVQNAEDKG